MSARGTEEQDEKKKDQNGNENRKETGKENRRKPKYGLFSCVGYIYRLLWQTEPHLVFTGIFTVPLTLGLSALTLYTPTLILRTLETSHRFSYIALVFLGLMLVKLLFDLGNSVIQEKTAESEHYVVLRMQYIENVKRRYEDWFLSLDPEIRQMNERSRKACQNNHTAGVHFPMDFAGMLASILNFILFGSVISMLNPLIVLLLALGCAVNYLFAAWERKKGWEGRDVRNELDIKLTYIGWYLAHDFKYAKDIRLYQMKDGIHERFMHLIKQRDVEGRKLERRRLFVAVVNFLIVLIRDIAAYAFLIYKALRGEVDASSFVLYFSAITSMSGVMERILGMVNRVLDGALQVSDFRERMELRGKLNQGEGIPVPTAPFSIEFKNVFYKYPLGEKMVLDNISFRIEAGEKIALVGLNGAGKTTLTMMMCGLILPDEGEILLDGHTLFEYNRDEMYGLFGFVPQDYHLLPVSIAANIACTVNPEEIDQSRLERCIQLAGLSEKLASLPLGADTPLNREINEDGVELSGGETQKLLLARLLYKDPLCIILDEPTAALDAIAEDQMYRRYEEIAANATSIFISHRLASTRFCDRIFLLEDGKFAEIGTHEELMAAGGKYRELFDVQSKYYKEAV